MYVDLILCAFYLAVWFYVFDQIFLNQENTELERSASPEPVVGEEQVQGLKPQDLQEAKDTLIVETSDMLHVPLFTAEALLRNHGNHRVKWWR